MALTDLAASPILLESLPPFWRTVRLALGMRPEIYVLAQTAANGLSVALLIMLLAACSEAVGQSVVLLLNRVRPWRFAPAVLLSIFSNVVGYLLWSLAIWLAVRLAFGVEIEFVDALVLVGLAYAPQLLSFFELAPYFGNFFNLVFTLWTMAAIVVAVRFGMGLVLWQAVLTGMLSWLGIQVWRRSLGRPVYALGRWMTRKTAGKPLAWSLDDVVEGRLHREQYSTNWHEWRRQWAQKRGAPRGAVGSGKALRPAAAAEDTDDLPAVPLPPLPDGHVAQAAYALPAHIGATGGAGDDRHPG